MIMPAVHNKGVDNISSKTGLLVLGIGNLLLGDEGVGIRAIKLLETLNWPNDIRLLDGGTGGFQLIGELSACEEAIVIDATIDKDPPGTIKVIRPKYASDFPRSLSAHEFGLRDLIIATEFLGQLPDITLVVMSIAPPPGLCTELSKEIESELPRFIALITELIEKSGWASKG